ncbi:MAG: outer membrane lipoprotein-sorting protein [Spirochaetales bacterium]|nr:outer membrane lipoprotein-sorting protein [Spirochaetales bacterium]
MKTSAFIICMVLIMAQGLFAITAEEIVGKIEENENISSYSEGRFEITDNLGKRVTTFKSYQNKDGDLLLEFTNPEDAGQKILRLENEIYLYFPDAVEIIHLQGDALKDRVMGSDFSYEDLRGGKSLLDKYAAELGGTETVDGRECYKLVLTEKPGAKDVIYPKQVLWVDVELFAYRKGELYSYTNREGEYRLIKEMSVSDIRRISGRSIPFYMEMTDTMKKNSITVFELGEMKIDIKIDPNIFSLEELTW